MRKAARAARWVVAFLAAAVLLGIGTPLPRASVDAADVHAAGARPLAGLGALGDLNAIGLAAPDVHPSVPPGWSVPAPAPAAEAPPAAAPASAPPASGAPASRISAPPSPRIASRPAAVPSSAVPAPAAGRLPLPVHVGSSTQVVTVVAPSTRSTTATVTAWQLGAPGWTAVVGPVAARIGAAGVGTAGEDSTRTPAGTFSLTEGFGRLGNPGTRLPYRVINASDYWVSDRTSTLYNQFYECSAACPFDTAAGEHLVDAGASYDDALVIDYNRHPAVPGAGSAFFLHVTDGAATAGCVAIAQSSLVAIMKWLVPAARPLISIGVGR